MYTSYLSLPSLIIHIIKLSSVYMCLLFSLLHYNYYTLVHDYNHYITYNNRSLYISYVYLSNHPLKCTVYMTYTTTCTYVPI